jgi:hypothetical protein
MKFRTKIHAKWEIVSTANVQAIAKELLDKFFGDLHLPIPKFKIVNNVAANWQGQCVFTPKDTSNTTINIQKRILGDDKTVRRILGHELIHHADFMLHGAGNKFEHRLHGGHGKFFKEYAAKINAVMGEDYVTEKSDASYVEEDNQTEFYVLIRPARHAKDKELGWSFAVRPSPKQKEYMQRIVKEGGGKIIKSKDKKFLRGPKIGLGGGIAIPRDEEFANLLRRLYEEA